MERDRRATAGKRMTKLVGEAQEQDDEFWNHETWQEDSESYHSSSDEEQPDVFDSDFDESESDNEEQEIEQGAQEERQLQLENRNQKKRSSAYVETARPVSQTKKRIKGKQLVTGEGQNAGIVLNMPGSSAPLPPIRHVPSIETELPREEPLKGDVETRPLLSQTSAEATPKSGIALRRQRRAAASRHMAIQSVKAPKGTTTTQELGKDLSANEDFAPKKPKAKPAPHMSQEALLLEAASVTEQENSKWLLARKRHQEDLQEFHKEQAAVGGSRNGTAQMVSSYSSKRGQLNLIHFCDMDHLPDILRHHPTPTRAEARICAVTGKPAKYRDPKTLVYYSNCEAFKELRRRLAAGEIQVPKPNVETSSQRAGVKALDAVEGKVIDDTSKPIQGSQTKPSQAKARKDKRNGKEKKLSTTTPSLTATSTQMSESTNVLQPTSVMSSVHSLESTSRIEDKIPRQEIANITSGEGDRAPHSKDSNGLSTAVESNNLHQSFIVEPSDYDHPHLARVDSQRSLASNSSSLSRRASPRRWKPSLKLLENLGGATSPDLPLLTDNVAAENSNGLSNPPGGEKDR